MARLRRFLALHSEEQSLFLRALYLMTGVRLALYVFPLQSVVRQLEKGVRRYSGQPAKALSPDRAAKRLEQAARLCPLNVSCLVQALVSRVLLAEYGYEATIRIGVLKSGSGIEAHAWLECPGQVVVGNATPSGKTFVPVIGAERLVE